MMNSGRKTSLATPPRGFTIVELMIAASVLATLLVLVTIVITGIGRLYFKGLNQTRIQNTTRSIIGSISEELQLSDGQAVVRPSAGPAPPNPSGPRQDIAFEDTRDQANNPDTIFTISAFCLKNTRYTYILNRQIGSDDSRYQIDHVLWRDPKPAECTPADLTDPALTGGTELMPPNSRLTAFSITPDSPYTITVGIAYGDSDLLDIKGPNTNGTTFSSDGLKTSCRGDKGNEFCATSNLQTAVVKRLVGGN